MRVAQSLARSQQIGTPAAYCCLGQGNVVECDAVQVIRIPCDQAVLTFDVICDTVFIEDSLGQNDAAIRIKLSKQLP